MSNVKIGFHPTGNLIEAHGGAQANVLSSQIFFTPAFIGSPNEEEIKLPESVFPAFDHPLYFREDSFDPAIRVRRGRFYKRGNLSHSDFHISPQATGPQSLAAVHSLTVADLGTNFSKMQVRLGLKSLNTAWSVVQAEPITTGEILVTLKAISYLGVLPDLNESRIPESHRKHILEKMNKLAQDFHVATPNAIVELARDAGSAIMSAVVAQNNLSDKPKDLSESAKLFSDHCFSEKKVGRYNVGHCAKVLANLHNQNKSVEQLKNDHRPIDEGDSEVAVRCLSQMVRDLGWA